MKLEKAIEILQALKFTQDSDQDYEASTALKLGIEALEAILLHRKDFRQGHIEHLPSETDE